MSSATLAPEPEPHPNNDDDKHAINSASQYSHAPSPETEPITDDRPSTSDSNIKVEGNASHDRYDRDDKTATTLRPDPQPSQRRRESTAAAECLQSSEILVKSKKRKRGPSPPWRFGVVENSTVKTVDGRRISARVHAGTPLLSETESRGRSGSQSAARSRPPSPPWKKFEAEGPTSVQVDGVRKSGRVNKDLAQSPKPVRTSPRQRKQADKAADDEKRNGVTRPLSRGKPVKAPAQVMEKMQSPSVRKSESRRSLSPSSKIAELKARIAALQPTRSFDATMTNVNDANSTHKRKHSDDEVCERRLSSPTSTRKNLHSGNSVLAPVSQPSPKIKLRLGAAPRRQINPPHPHSQPRSPAKPPKLSLPQVIEPYELLELQQPYMENERGPPAMQFFNDRNSRLAVEEAAMRRRLVAAAQPGGVLSKEVCTIFRYDEPEQPSTHIDYLTMHALNFRMLQQKERTRHMQQAKKIAHEALEAWKVKRGPTEEDIRAEQDRIFRLIYKQVVFDMRAKWDMVIAHVNQLRKERWEIEEDARRQERLQRQLEQAEAMVARQRADDDDSDLEMEDSTGDIIGSDSEESDGEEESDEAGEENMSDSDSDGDESEEEEEGEMTGEALEAYLASQREAEPPDKSTISADSKMATTVDGDARSFPPEAMQVDDPRPDIKSEAETFDDSAQLASGPASRRSSIAAALTGDADDAEREDPLDEYRPASLQESSPAVTKELMHSPGPGSRSTRRSLAAAASIASLDDEVHGNADLNLSDDESTDMYDSDEDMSSSSSDDDDGDNESGSEGDESGVDQVERAESSLVGMLFGKSQLRSALGLPTPTTSAEGDAARERTADPVSSDEPALLDPQVEADAGENDSPPLASINSVLENEVRELANQNAAMTIPKNNQTNGVDVDMDIAPDVPTPATETLTVAKQLTPVPTLLRGTLRSYQHAGLDWLASLHRNGTNGILADEMGLGKTIQTIALLAHLAEHCGIWETHLIIVPTSVILNWVAEFHKFLPGFRVLGYYGTAEERMQKRKGWVNDPHHENKDRRGYNVVITSYNVAMADINAIRNVQWHYLVLDEAHTIRNFNSQRWQILIRLKTKARLLLTGTPLQNSLAELWSLLAFLTAGDDDPAHGDLEEFLSHWKQPVKEIFDAGVNTLSDEAHRVVEQLHISLRPFLLRRLKSEVEKDLPKKTEKVIVCKLSKRQRQLYQEYMGLASTKASLASGNTISTGRVLMSLKKVCNHPDQFDPRPIQTSYAMEIAVAETYCVKEALVRKMLGLQNSSPEALVIVRHETRKRYATKRSRQLDAAAQLQQQINQLQTAETPAMDLSSPAGCLVMQRLRKRQNDMQNLKDAIQISVTALSEQPVYGADLRQLLTLPRGRMYMVRSRAAQSHNYNRSLRALPTLGSWPLKVEHRSDWILLETTELQRGVLTLDRLAEKLDDTITRFAFCTPVATAPVLDLVVPLRTQKILRATDAYPFDQDFAHQARTRTSIAFPDRRLLIYDSGKLQRLATLLREQLAKGSRSLIFTQMMQTLNILESFLNLLGLPYLRLDGSTSPERRMLYSSEFNRPDSKYACMILSSRAGGVGLNLTGASSVIFYDLDWNPQMDRQCMDRAHRIGQVRDVEVFKLVSEKTVEENILRRANQKSLLDKTVIQEGHFTTEYQQPNRRNATASSGEEPDEDELQAAIDRVFSNEITAVRAIASVEDREDAEAAAKARRQENIDADEFNERGSSKGRSAAPTPGPSGGFMDDDREEDGDDIDRKGHIDNWMVAAVEDMLRDVPYVPPVVRKLDKHGRDPSHRPKKRR